MSDPTRPQRTGSSPLQRAMLQIDSGTIQMNIMLPVLEALPQKAREGFVVGKMARFGAALVRQAHSVTST